MGEYVEQEEREITELVQSLVGQTVTRAEFDPSYTGRVTLWLDNGRGIRFKAFGYDEVSLGVEGIAD